MHCGVCSVLVAQRKKFEAVSSEDSASQQAKMASMGELAKHPKSPEATALIDKVLPVCPAYCYCRTESLSSRADWPVFVGCCG